MIKNPPASAGDVGLIPGREDPLEEEMAPTPVSLPGKSHEERRLVGYSPWGHKRVGHDLATEHSTAQELIR